MTQTSVSVLGLGVMGAALSGALLSAGHPTTVWNRSAHRADGLVSAGAARAATAADAVAASPLVVLCVVHNDAVREVLDPIADRLAGKTLVNLTNGTPTQARELAIWATEHGARYLDGGIMAIPPMIGGPDALVLYSGDEQAFGTHRETLRAFGGERFLGTDPGQAALYDLALLSGMYGLFAGFLHAVALVRAEGVKAGELLPLMMPWLEAMLPSLEHTARQVDSGDYGGDLSSPLAMQAAGFDNLLDAARDRGVRPDLLAPLGRLLDLAVEAGHGEHDIASLVEVLRVPAG